MAHERRQKWVSETTKKLARMTWIWQKSYERKLLHSWIYCLLLGKKYSNLATSKKYSCKNWQKMSLPANAKMASRYFRKCCGCVTSLFGVQREVSWLPSAVKTYDINLYESSKITWIHFPILKRQIFLIAGYIIFPFFEVVTTLYYQTFSRKYAALERK